MMNDEHRGVLLRRRQRRVGLWLAALSVVPTGLGCASNPAVPPDDELGRMAGTYLEYALRYPDNPAVRAQAMEAAGDLMGAQARPWLREGVKDEASVVRFAACMALGRLDDPGDVSAVRSLVDDPDPNVRIGAYFVLERAGDHTHRRAWRDLLRGHEDSAVRRNAVLALGHLENPDVMPLLRVAASDDLDDGVRIQALEGLALLGDRDAIGQFLYEAFGGVGFRQPFALLTLGRTADSRAVPTLRRGLVNAPYLEARLAAARSLGMQGHRDGFNTALKALDWSKPERNTEDDPPVNQIMRIRTMAAMALGEIGDRRALGALIRRMEDPDDPRVQLAAATAILMILKQSPELAF